MATGQKLLATPDAVTLKTPREGELVTHRDFDNAAAALDAAVAAATTEDYTPVDTTALDARYDAAIARVPAAGKGFTPGTRAALMSEIATAATLRDQAAYATADQVSQEVTALEDVMDALVEEPLGEAFTLTVRYQHPMEGAPSDLIHEYFNDAAGNPVEEQVPVHRGQEMRYPLTDETLIKRFEGYTPRSFHLNSDDGTLGLVQVLTDSKGVRTVAFRADTTSPAGGGSLDIRYVAGQDTRVAPSPTPGPETPADPGTGADQAAAPAVDPAVGPSAGAAAQAAAAQAADDLARARADLYNLQQEYQGFVRRSREGAAGHREAGQAAVVEALIPVLDEIELARQHGDLTGTFATTATKLETVLADKFHLERFGAVGEVFDPTLHEALMATESTEVTETTVTMVLQPGYRLGERVVRAARVQVANPA